MEILCPHCLAEFRIGDPFHFMDYLPCPSCRKPIYTECSENEEGPVFSFYKEEPGYELYPPGDRA
jgi:hypothetical protein